MSNKFSLFLAVVLSVFTATPLASAHHGTASFDKDKLTTLNATVTNFIWTNPHGGIEFNVKDSKGNVEKWQGSLSSPNWLAREGWTKNTLKAGDQITVIGNTSKSRAYTIWITKVRLADGQELSMGGVENLE